MNYAAASDGEITRSDQIGLTHFPVFGTDRDEDRTWFAV
jgi:hypothetical protein